MKDPNEPIFTRRNLKAAMAAVCGYYHGHSVQERFKVETPAIVGALDDLLQKSETVLDYGIGVGRVAKAILEQYPHIQVIGVDNSKKMLELTREYIPHKYFTEGRIRLYDTLSLHCIADGSVDLMLAIYVLTHISAPCLEGTVNHIERLMKDDGKLYVLNQIGRAVPREKRWGIYKKLRKVFGFLESLCEYKQGQRFMLKLDNRTIIHDDGIDIQAVLEKNFEPLYDVPLGGHPLIERLMRKHFSRVYAKRPKV